MYLLMLLATYVSAIYGYNLSIRPDYDRDVAYKKAAAVVYKTVNQHNAAKSAVLNVQHGDYAYGEPQIPWIQPNDLVYAKSGSGVTGNEKNVVLEYKQGGDKLSIPVRAKGRLGEAFVDGKNILLPGRLLYDADMMVSKVLCPTNEIDETSATASCTSPTDDTDGSVTGSCCGTSYTSYIVSYRKLDARWLNRLTNSVNSDFMKAFKTEDYRNNVGVITWNEGKGAWEFVGRINLLAVYRKDREKFMEDNHDNPLAMYPWDKMNRTNWTLPKNVFTRDFFTDASGSNTNFCQHGCVFRIDTI